MVQETSGQGARSSNFFQLKILVMMMPKILSESHGPQVFKTTLTQHRKRRLQKSIGVVLTKYSPKVKSENFHNSRVPELRENYVYLDLWGFWGFYSNIELTFVSWRRRSFLTGKIFINACILQGFLWLWLIVG